LPKPLEWLMQMHYAEHSPALLPRLAEIEPRSSLLEEENVVVSVARDGFGQNYTFTIPLHLQLER
jgi:hypothetical protein